MCWNAEVSLQSFLVGLASIGIGALRGASFPVLLFALTIVFMQLIEYIVWSNYENKEINRQASLAARALLWTQPIASILTTQSPGPMLVAYFVTTLLVSFLGPERDYSMTRAPNGHLAWNWLTKEPSTYLSLAVYFVFLLLPLIMSRSFLLLGLSLGTLAVSLYTFWKDNTWGSMWCWMINWVAVASLLKEGPGSVHT
jgi:hypothetical protein